MNKNVKIGNLYFVSILEMQRYKNDRLLFLTQSVNAVQFFITQSRKEKNVKVKENIW